MTGDSPSETPCYQLPQDAIADNQSRVHRVKMKLRTANRKDWWFIAAPTIGLLSLMGICIALQADIAISKLFFAGDKGGWFLAKCEPWNSLYLCGCRPGLWMGIAGILIACASLVYAPAKRSREFGLFLMLSLLLGPGLIVNGVLKPWVARPRPFEVAQFGGPETFTYIGQTYEGRNSNNSFPSGHASMGFFLMTPALYLYRRRPRIAATLLIFGAGYGTLMGVARIAQGAHFTTDVLGSALCVYAAGTFLILVSKFGPLLLPNATGNQASYEGPATLAFERTSSQPATSGARKAA